MKHQRDLQKTAEIFDGLSLSLNGSTEAQCREQGGEVGKAVPVSQERAFLTILVVRITTVPTPHASKETILQ